MNNKHKYYLISGPIIALGLMLGTAIGASIGNIKIGVALGLIFGVIFNATHARTARQADTQSARNTQSGT